MQLVTSASALLWSDTPACECWYKNPSVIRTRRSCRAVNKLLQAPWRTLQVAQRKTRVWHLSVCSDTVRGDYFWLQVHMGKCDARWYSMWFYLWFHNTLLVYLTLSEIPFIRGRHASCAFPVDSWAVLAFMSLGISHPIWTYSFWALVAGCRACRANIMNSIARAAEMSSGQCLLSVTAIYAQREAVMHYTGLVFAALAGGCIHHLRGGKE